MPVVRNELRYPSGEPIASERIQVRLIADARRQAPGYVGSGEYEVLGSWPLATDENGVWALELVANADIEPQNTYYEVREPQPGFQNPVVSAFRVPSDAGPHWLRDLLIVPPEALGLALAAPSGASYLLGEPSADLPDGIVAGPAPGGELGGTWASPTVDALHSGSSHAGAQAAAEAHSDAGDAAHLAAGDPHPQYDTAAEAAAAIGAHSAAGDPHGDRAHADAGDAAHLAAGDPHPQYDTAAEAAAAIGAHSAAGDPHGDRAYSDATFVPLAQKGAANGVATLDAGSKIPTAQLPSLAINDVFVVASQAAMLALVAQRGDMAVRSDLSRSFVLSTDAPGTLGDWIELASPPDAVLSVDGRSGAVSLSDRYEALGAVAAHTALSNVHHNKSHAHDGADGSGTVAHSALTGITIDDHHARDHAVTAAVHTAAGLAAGQVLRASGANAFAWAVLQHADVGAISADQHHPQLHAGAHKGGGDNLDNYYARLGSANTFTANQFVSTDGSTTSTPTRLGFTNLTAAEAARIPLGDDNSGIQIGYGQRAQFYAFDTIELHGQRRQSNALAFTAASGSSPGVIVVAEVATMTAFQIQAAASQAGNILEAVKSDGTVYSTISENGYFTTRKTAAPADGELSNSEAAYWLDATPGATKFNVKAKDSAGTVRTGSLALA